MAGTNPNFSPDAFRQGIRLAMRMGAPGSTDDQATFRWNVARTFNVKDPAGAPYDWTAVPAVTETHADVVTQLVAVEFVGRPEAGAITNIGAVDSSVVTITVMDEDYEEIEGANEVLLGGNTYVIRYQAPPIGLFGVTVRQLFAEALDES